MDRGICSPADILAKAVVVRFMPILSPRHAGSTWNPHNASLYVSPRICGSLAALFFPPVSVERPCTAAVLHA